MASGIAHDINNAISPVAIYTESLLETEHTLSPRARNYLSTIQRAIEDVAQTVARMREFYRERAPQLALVPISVNRVVREVIEVTRARWRDMPLQRGVVINVHLDLAAGEPIIRGLESEIRESLTNLVFNAVDAMPEGGTLTIRTGRADDRPFGKLASGSRAIIIEVTDTGVGMDAETRRRCLEPFFTTKGERGTGLGLAMVYGMVQRHSGDIDIESTPGQGTTARLVFAVPSDVVEPPLHRPDTPRVSPLRVLIVDDDPVLLASLQNVLETDGHLVTAASGGQTGIDLCQTAHRDGAAFDIVITDLGMPHVGGRQVARAVNQVSPDTAVILLTGWGQRMLDDGEVPPFVNRVLSKPPKLAEVRLALFELKPLPL
jgi:CheY-like chemotaxis protein/anti-sigma regulatory factor (Ser/Thr protein kinase)